MKTFLIAAALVAGSAVPAIAQQTAIVSYKTSDLTTVSGREGLRRRVQGAVVQVCGSDRVPGSMIGSTKVRDCYKKAADAARPQVDRAIALATRGVDVASAR